MVVLITGASSGIGLAIANHLSKIGFTVYGGSRTAPESDKFHVLKLDVTNDESVFQAIESIVKKEGRIDVLINNAGIGSAGAIEKTPMPDIRKSFDVNFYGVVRMTQAVLPYMRKHQFGRIINMSTLGSAIGLPYRSFYSASKGAIDLFTEALRLEVAKYGILSCTIHPGEVRTQIAEHRVISTGKDDETYGPTITKVFDKLDASVHHGKDPSIFGPLVEKIIRSEKVKRNYYIGTFSERLGVKLKRFLPYYMYEAILRNYFAS